MPGISPHGGDTDILIISPNNLNRIFWNLWSNSSRPTSFLYSWTKTPYQENLIFFSHYPKCSQGNQGHSFNGFGAMQLLEGVFHRELSSSIFKVKNIPEHLNVVCNSAIRPFVCNFRQALRLTNYVVCALIRQIRPFLKLAPLPVTGRTPQILLTSRYCGALFALPTLGWWSYKGKGYG